MRGKRSVLLGLVVLVCGGVLPKAVAEDAPGQLKITIDDLVSHQSISEEDAPLIQAALKGRSVAEFFGLDRMLKSLPILAHYRGSEGSEFPTLRTAFPFDVPAAEYAKAEKLLEEKGEEHLKKLRTVEDLPDCAESRTERQELPFSDQLSAEEKAGVSYDRLYIRASKVPADPQKEFGQLVVVRAFQASEGSASADTLRTQSAKVKCLPYRERVTGEALYFHFGEDALKHFDSPAAPLPSVSLAPEVSK